MLGILNLEGKKWMSAYVPVLFTATIFTSALLLFFVQPLFTRLVLPQIGGAAAVWTTAMLFFQTVLIAGYVYAHVLTRHLSPTLQITVHIGLLGLAIFFLPLAVPEGWQYDATSPVVTQTLWLYALGVGLPFAVLSATAPLLQFWYSRSGGPSANDPYFLYAASNLGSFIALLAFPLVAEPLFGLSTIAIAWSVGFVALGGLLLLSGLAARRPAESAASPSVVAGPAPKLRTMAYWAFLAFIPSSLMLGVTSKISVDLGAVPLIWVIPLSLYLLTFVLTFSERSPLSSNVLRPALLASLTILLLIGFETVLTWQVTALLIFGFLGVALMAHRLLYEARPDARNLTLFYIVMSVGGACGGILNSIVGPVLFDRFYELPVTLACAALLMLNKPLKSLPRELTLGLIGTAIVMIPLLGLVPGLGGTSLGTRMMISGGVLMAVLWALRTHGTASAATFLMLVAGGLVATQVDVLLQDRSFFGAHIVRDKDGIRLYSNGSTLHGAQRISETSARPTPLLYYYEKAPLAQLLTSAKGKSARTVGIVGLGVGALSCYSQPGQTWHFYEIDSMVVDIANNPDLFTFMSKCGKDAETHLGDARIVLERQTDLRFDVLVIDAYSSDSVPVHLATKEAIDLYRNRLTADGVLLIHISNRYFDLSMPLARAAGAVGMKAFIQNYKAQDKTPGSGDTDSTVVAMAATDAGLGDIVTDPRWSLLATDGNAPWLDDHANLLSALR